MAAFAPPEVDLGLHGFLLKVGWGRVAHVGELGDRGLGTGWALLCHRRAMLSTARSRWHGPGADLKGVVKDMERLLKASRIG